MTKHPIALAAALLLTACPDESEQMCTDDARSSVTLTVVDDTGATIPEATASFSVDGSAAEACEGFSGSFACGWEQPGLFTVTAEAPGYAPATVDVEVGADECHVITEVVELELARVDCPDEAQPSVVVTVTDVQGAEVTSGDVVWNRAEEDDLPEPCTHLGDNQWACAEEVAGDLLIEIDNAGPYQPYAEVVTVVTDSCGVLTEQLDAVLEYLPD